MKNHNIIPLPVRLELDIPSYPTLGEAFTASQDLIYLQNQYPSLQTIEERDNNIHKSEQALETMSRYLMGAYLRESSPDSIN